MAFIRCKGIADFDPFVFGTGEDGDVVLLADTVFNPSAVDTGIIHKQYHDFTINSGVTLSVGDRNAGMIIRCTGNCTINGNITNLCAPKTLIDDSDLYDYYPIWMIENGCAGNGGAGGRGADVPDSSGANGGAGMTGRFYGGGYGGGGGGTGSQSGFSGFAGGSAENITTDIASIFVGGAPGTYGGGGRGGAGQAPGAGGSGPGGNGGNGGYNQRIGPAGGGGGAGNYGGGVIILFVKGTLTVNGTIDCHGSDGGTGGKWMSNASYLGGHGGGGGGGRIYLMAQGAMSLANGTYNVDGGANNATAGTKHYISSRDYHKGKGTPTSL